MTKCAKVEAVEKGFKTPDISKKTTNCLSVHEVHKSYICWHYLKVNTEGVAASSGPPAS